MENEKHNKITARIGEIERKRLGDLQFDLFPQHLRAVPNTFLRGALFAVSSAGEFYESVAITGASGQAITYTGYGLDQTDLDYLLGAYHQARGQDCKGYNFKLRDLFNSLEIADTGRARDIFDARMTKIRNATFTIKQGRSVYVGGMVDEYTRDEDGTSFIRINPKILNLFLGDNFTLLNWEVRKELRRMPLAQWLHAFYSSHEIPYPYKIQTLMEFSGSQMARAADFKVKLVRALAAVEAASKKHGQPFEYRIIGGLISVRRGKGRPLLD